MLHRNLIVCVFLFFIPGIAAALEIGFEGFATVSASDNVTGENAGSEIEGQIGTTQFGVFGEQKGRVFTGAFAGDLFSQGQLDDPDEDFAAITQFLGAAEINITPRSFSWYIGDILGGVRANDALQPIDDLQNTRRNVFVTGPQFVYDLDSFSRVNARLLYINQSEDDAELEQLYNATASWEVDTDSGNTFGFSFGDIFVDNPDDTLEEDSNRATLAAFWRRSRGTINYEAQLGGTNFSTDTESINGVNARFFLGRQMTPESNIAIELNRDLRDQTLSTIETLISEGTGLIPNGDGVFDETRIRVGYDFTESRSNFDVFVGASQSDFRLLTSAADATAVANLEDFRSYFAGSSYGRRLGTRWRAALSLGYEQQEFLNRDDNTSSVLGIAQFARQISRSFELDLGFRFSTNEGSITRAQGQPLEDIDVTESRLTLGLRWAPPTRAGKDLTIELKSLLQ